MATLTVQPLTASGLNPNFVTAGAAGDNFTNDGNVYLHVKNGGVSSITVTIDSVAPCSYGFDHNLVITVPAGGERLTPRLSRARFNDANDKVNVTYSDNTSVTVAVIGV